MLSDTLEAAFGAGSEPAAWLRCFDDNEATIIGAACLLLQHDPLADPVLVRARDLGPPSAAGTARAAPVQA